MTDDSFMHLCFFMLGAVAGLVTSVLLSRIERMGR